MTRIKLIAVGACAIDNILIVPHYPGEDSKLRALSLTKRRGGNCPNSLEVLLQLTSNFAVSDSRTASSLDHDNARSSNPDPSLSLIAILPSRSSPQISFIASSFNTQRDITNNEITEPNLECPSVDLSKCIYRETYTEPISSYIISSQSTSSRTVVNHNDLPEMTFDEFVEATRDLLDSATSVHNQKSDRPGTDSLCIRYLRQHFVSKALTTASANMLRISVELEKPGRQGLQELAFEADVVFYSKSWAEGEGYDSSESCLERQANLLLSHKRGSGGNQLLVCTWNVEGACALQLSPGPDDHTHTRQSGDVDNGSLRQQIVRSPAHVERDRSAVDTIGAGDTFLAGMLFGLICRSGQSDNSSSNSQSAVALGQVISKRQPVWSLRQKLDFANGIAGRKVLQHGFRGLGRELEGLVKYLDCGVV